MDYPASDGTVDRAFDTGADWLGLRGKVCVVTGGAGGIGAAIALAFGRAGAAVGVLDRPGTQHEAAIERVVGQVRAGGGTAIALGCDIANTESVRKAADTCRNLLGPCEVLVNNAAVSMPSALMEMHLERWNAALAVNLTGALACTQAFGAHMIERGAGALAHVASIGGSVPLPFGGAYSVSKAGLLMLSSQLALELADHGIRSNVVSPGLVRTPLSERFYQDNDVLIRRAELVPARRIAMPEDIADAVLFAVSERASYVNGQEILVDGGLARNLMAMLPPGYAAKPAR